MAVTGRRTNELVLLPAFRRVTRGDHCPTCRVLQVSRTRKCSWRMFTGERGVRVQGRRIMQRVRESLASAGRMSHSPMRASRIPRTHAAKHPTSILTMDTWIIFSKSCMFSSRKMFEYSARDIVIKWSFNKIFEKVIRILARTRVSRNNQLRVCKIWFSLRVSLT